MYRRLIKPILFAMNIERAHSVVLWLLRVIGKIPGGRWLLRRNYCIEHPSLEREVFGLKFRNPIGIAAGFDRNAEVFREMCDLGFGFVEVGTITPLPQPGLPRPRIFRLPKDHAIINRTGLSNKGLNRVVAQLRHRHDRLIIGANIGKNALTHPGQVPADYLRLFRSLYQYVDYFTINVCCDNCMEVDVSQDTSHLMKILTPLFDFRRGQNQYRPILIKISPDLSDERIDEITDLMQATPLDGIVAVNGQTHPRPVARQLPDHRRRRINDSRRRKKHARSWSKPRSTLHRIYLRRTWTGKTRLRILDRRGEAHPLDSSHFGSVRINPYHIA